MGDMAQEPSLKGPAATAPVATAGDVGPADDPRLELRESVGDVLRRAREGYREDLNLVAQTLKIRHAYLKAIEERDYQDLPGPTYAVGFVRTYADYLGLDSDELVRRFKEEVDGVDRTQELHFPTPAPESRVPGGAVLLISLLLVGAAYGGWFYLSGDDSRVADAVPPVPEDLQALIGEQPDAGTAAPETASAPEPASVPEPMEPSPAVGRIVEARTAGSGSPMTGAARPAPPTVATGPQSPPAGSAGDATMPVYEARSAEAMPATPSASEPSVAEPPAPEFSLAGSPGRTAREELAEAGITIVGPVRPDDAEPAEPPAVSATDAVAAVPDSAPVRLDVSPPAEPEPEPDSEAASESGAPEPAVAESAEAPPAAPEPAPARPSELQSAEGASPPQRITLDRVLGAGGTVIPAAPEATQIAALANEPPPQVYGADNDDARIVLRAKQDSWVQIRDEADELLLTRVLRRGDEYRVPNREGLTLRTGNAGGIVILVDGAPQPPIGPVGSVRGNVELDPERLLGGGTIQEQ